MSFTPGPWKVRKTFYGETYIEGKDGYYVCAFPVCSPNKKDVVMIAAAPDMYEMLSELRDEMDNMSFNLYSERDSEYAEDTRDSIHALLRRIEGADPE